MSSPFPHQVTVLIDERERKPLEFPKSLWWWSPARHEHLLRVRTVVKRLRTGDYAIRGYRDVVLVERKGSLSELAKNLFTRDVSRFRAALDRLQRECRHPTLLLDMSAQLRASRYARNPDQIIDGITREAIQRGLHLLWLPPTSRGTRTGELVLRWMWQCIYLEKLAPQRRQRDGDQHNGT